MPPHRLPLHQSICPTGTPQTTTTSHTITRLKKILIAIAGGALLIVGAVMIILPGPAIVVIPAALTILAIEFVWARRCLAWLRGRVKKPSSGKQPLQALAGLHRDTT